ncbi:MAG: O-antigen ligase family protein [Haliscomenobacter sp.]|nr:O-antigen ligase family protein [Haliscomenobacter sp.]
MKTVPSFFQKDGFFFTQGKPLLVWILCAALLTGMIYAPYLQSLSLFLLSILAVLSWDTSRFFPLRINPALIPSGKSFFHRPDFWVIALYFILVLAGGLYAQDMGYWLSRLRIKLPFLAIPFVFFLLPSLKERPYLRLWYFLLVLLSLTSLGILVNYLRHFEEVNLLIKQGQPVPMPCNHIRYSLLQTMGVAGGLFLLEKRFALRFRWETYVIAALTLWLIIAQHLIAVRSGLVVLYALLAFSAARYLWRTRRWLTGAVLLAALASGPVLAYQLAPSFRNKVGYMRYDLDMYFKGQDKGVLSDASRLISWKIGWDLFRRSPWIGVGPGNLRKEVEAIYATEYPHMEKRLMPHNQFLSVMAGSGAIGLAFFLTAFFVPLFYRKHYLHFPFLALHATACLSFIVEATLENAMGVAFFLFFLVLGLNHLNAKPQECRTVHIGGGTFSRAE